MATVYIGIGSNINAEENLFACAAKMRTLWPSVRFSRVFLTAPQGYKEQDDFLNAVAALETDESPKSVSAKLREMENDLKKNITERFGPRTIDLDVLLYGDLVQEDTELIIPHPRMLERKFVLAPLCDVLSVDAEHPVLKVRWKELLQKTEGQGCTVTDIEL